MTTDSGGLVVMTTASEIVVLTTDSEGVVIMTTDKVLFCRVR